MGSNHCETHHQWIPQFTLMDVAGYPTIYRNANMFQIQCYQVPSTAICCDQQALLIYQLRMEGLPNVPLIYQKPTLSTAKHCMLYDETLTIHSEYMAARLHHLPILPQRSAAYILHQALVGYQTLCKLHFICQPSLDKIAIAPEGSVRVWVDANFALNTYGGTLMSEYMMVKALCCLMEAKTITGQFNPKVKIDLDQMYPITFQNCLRVLKNFDFDRQTEHNQLKAILIERNFNKATLLAKQPNSPINRIKNQNDLRIQSSQSQLPSHRLETNFIKRPTKSTKISMAKHSQRSLKDQRAIQQSNLVIQSELNSPGIKLTSNSIGSHNNVSDSLLEHIIAFRSQLASKTIPK